MRPTTILYLVHRVPYPPDKGDRIRTFQILEWLSHRASVHLACLADEPAGEGVIAELRRYCEQLAVVPIGRTRWLRALGSLALGRTATEGAFSSPALRSILRRWAGQTRFDAALASASSLVPYLRMPELGKVPAVVDFIDVDSQKWLDYAAEGRGPWSWLYSTEGRRLRRLERDVAAWARSIVVVSEPEADLYRRFCPGARVHAITCGVDLENLRPNFEAVEHGCVFVGALDYRPNIDGLVWFCREVWPRLHRQHPGARLSVVGRRPAPAVGRLAEVPGVDVIGQVHDVRPYLAGATVSIAPLRIARGVQTKVLEAMAMGKAVVASPQALTGLGAEPGVHLLVASTPAEWVESVDRLLGDHDLRRRLGAEGRRYVEANHHWDRCLGPFGTLLGLPGVAAPAEGHPDGLYGRGATPAGPRRIVEESR